MYVAMVSEGCSQMVLDGFRRAHNLPMSEVAPARIVIRAAVLAPRPKQRFVPCNKKVKPTAATSPARVATRFDLKD